MSLADERVAAPEPTTRPDVRPEDLIVAAICLVGAVVTILDSLPRYVGNQGLGSGAFPTWIAVFLAICALVMLGRALRERRLAPMVDWPRGERLRRFILAAGSLVFYLLALPYLGFTISTTLLLVFQLRVLGDFSWRVSVLAGVGAALLIWLVFAGLLFMALPRGLVGF